MTWSVLSCPVELKKSVLSWIPCRVVGWMRVQAQLRKVTWFKKNVHMLKTKGRKWMCVQAQLRKEAVEQRRRANKVSALMRLSQYRSQIRRVLCMLCNLRGRGYVVD